MPNKAATVQVPEAGEVFLDALIGEAQDGSKLVFLGPDELTTATRVLHRSLGDAARLVGQSLVVSATVVDVREEHDRTAVAVELSGAVVGSWGRGKRPPMCLPTGASTTCS